MFLPHIYINLLCDGISNINTVGLPRPLTNFIIPHKPAETKAKPRVVEVNHGLRTVNGLNLLISSDFPRALRQQAGRPSVNPHSSHSQRPLPWSWHWRLVTTQSWAVPDIRSVCCKHRRCSLMYNTSARVWCSGGTVCIQHGVREREGERH